MENQVKEMISWEVERIEMFCQEFKEKANWWKVNKPEKYTGICIEWQITLEAIKDKEKLSEEQLINLDKLLELVNGE